MSKTLSVELLKTENRMPPKENLEISKEVEAYTIEMKNWKYCTQVKFGPSWIEYKKPPRVGPTIKPKPTNVSVMLYSKIKNCIYKQRD